MSGTEADAQRDSDEGTEASEPEPESTAQKSCDSGEEAAAEGADDDSAEGEDSVDERPGSATAKGKPSKPEKKGKWLRRLLYTLLASPVMILALWLAVHHIPGFGPLVADTLRAILGPGAVAWMEDTAYGVEDWVNRKTKADEPPKAFWEVPSGLPANDPSAATSARDGVPAKPPFSLANIG
ncbi:MAG: hypothetical protein JRI68_31915, partial [Deltaproteobacteria bacterium]|nr:hypothetical protein [Deltaproteobacteria bacterium]